MNLFTSLFSKGTESNNLDSVSFEKMLKEDKTAILLDVRTEQENSQGRIPNSVLIDIHKSDFLQRIQKLDKSKSYLLYCRSGSRSYSALKQMQKLGFTNVYNLRNGISNWHGKVERG